MLCPLGEYDANNDRNPSADPENNSQRSWEEEFCVEKSHYESESDQTERNSESSPIGLHEVRVGTFCQPSFLLSFKPPCMSDILWPTAKWAPFILRVPA